MKQVFYSRKGPEIVFPLGIVLGSVTFLLAWSAAWPAFGVLLLLDAFILHLLLNTSYTLEGRDLHIRCGWLYYRKLNINRIVRIEETRNPLSSPATSLDRLGLVLEPRDYIMISPADKAGFIQAICSLQPGVQVRYRKQAGMAR